MEQSLLNDFRRCPEEGADEAHIAALIARLLDEQVDVRSVEAELDDLARICAPTRSPWEMLDGLGFAGNRDDYEALDNSNLAWVLAQRRGIPITLGVVLIRTARGAGRRAVGVNFPGHFLVEVDRTLVDPFVMQTIDVDGFLERLPADARRQPIARLFAHATPVAVGLRMLNNVKLAHVRGAAWHRALDAVDAQLALVPRQPALHLERGELWQRLGLVEPARAAFQEALVMTDALTSDAPTDPWAPLRATVRARLDELGDADDVVH